MKFAIAKLEKLALTAHLVPQPSPSPELADIRKRMWAELGVTDLAKALAMSFVGLGPGPLITPWADIMTMEVVDLGSDSLKLMLNGINHPNPPIPGSWVDVITDLRPRLEQLRDGKYVLPPELEASS